MLNFNIENSKIVVFGGSGMIGRQIVKQLTEYKAIVYAPTHAEVDLLHAEEVNSYMDRVRPDYLIHAAGYNGGIRFNAELPTLIFHRTVLMAINILNAARAYGTKKVITILTSCAYPPYEGKLNEECFMEGLPHESVICHGFGKRVLYLYGLLNHKQYGLKVVPVIFNNCYGPYFNLDPERGKVTESLIVKFVKAKRNNEKEVTLWGTGLPRREILYSEDAATGLIYALKHYGDNSPINIGSGIDFTIKELAETIKELVGYKGEIVWDTSKPDGQMQKLLDVDKMNKSLLFYPNFSLKQGLMKTILWYESYLDTLEASDR